VVSCSRVELFCLSQSEGAGRDDALTGPSKSRGTVTLLVM
jgi:hypothetical protein